MARDAPDIFTTDCCANPEPFTVKVLSVLPTFRLAGERLLMLGTGFTVATDAEAVLEVSAALVAVTVTSLGISGAV